MDDAIGSLVRNYQGKFIIAFFDFISEWPILYVEILAMWRGLQFYLQISVHTSEVETNFPIATKIIYKRENVPWFY